MKDTTDICEIRLFLDQQTLPSNCKIHHFQDSKSFFQKLKQKNSWLYWTPHIQSISVICLEHTEMVKIQGNEILSINDTCHIVTQNNILKPHLNRMNKHFSEDFSPKFQLINSTKQLLEKINKIKDFKIIKPDLNPVDANFNSLIENSNSLNKIITVMENEESKMETQKTDLYHNYLLYLLGIAMAYVAIHYIIQFLKNKCRQFWLGKSESVVHMRRNVKDYGNSPL